MTREADGWIVRTRVGAADSAQCVDVTYRWDFTDEIALHDEVKVSDLPDGQWRYTRPSGGFRATVVAGTPTVLDGAATGAVPARIGDAAAAARG